MKPLTVNPTDADRRAAIRVPVTDWNGPVGRFVGWLSRRLYGDVLDISLVLRHHKPALATIGALELGVARWKVLTPTYRTLAIMATSAAIGCSWCLDFGYYEARDSAIDPRKLREVPRWRTSDVYDDTERLVLAYAEGMTATPPEVDDEVTERLRAALGEPGFVELTLLVAVENERSRANFAFGLTSQGFSDRCGLP